jgi:nitrous oxidase accessory protein NosD
MKLVRLAGPMALLVGLLAPVATVSAASAIYVQPGQSIQAAINKAPSGGLVVVERGTYKGNLDIKRSVRLVGHSAVIVPAAKPTKGFCLTPGFFTGVSGVCVHAVFSADGQSIVTPVSNVSIEGFTIQNFSGAGIVAVGVDGFRAVRDVTAHNGDSGIWINTVSNLSLLYNTVYGNGSDGFYVSSSPSSNAVIVGNVSYGNLASGILFVDSLGGRIALNTVYGNCSGIVVASVATPDVTPSGDVSIQLNQVTANNRMCPDLSASGGPPAYGGIGIGLVGGRNTIVALNDVRDNVEQAGSGITGGGIVILDGKLFGTGVPTGNSIRLNWLSGNTPYDINGDGTGTNTISGNSCTTTNLTGAC